MRVCGVRVWSTCGKEVILKTNDFMSEIARSICLSKYYLHVDRYKPRDTTMLSVMINLIMSIILANKARGLLSHCCSLHVARSPRARSLRQFSVVSQG
jgi:hypothetical protein